MKITLTQLKTIIREEVNRSLHEMPAPGASVTDKSKLKPGAVYFGKRKQTPVELNVELIGDDGTVYFTQLMSGKPMEMEMPMADFQAYLADPQYGFEWDHQEQW